MATQITTAPNDPTDDVAVVRYLNILDLTVDRVRDSRSTVAVPMTDITPMGFEFFKKQLEESTKARFEFHPDAGVGVLYIKPVPVSASMPSKEKVSRPKNAFLIFRLDEHAKILAEFPGIHNNEICEAANTFRGSAADLLAAKIAGALDLY